MRHEQTTEAPAARRTMRIVLVAFLLTFVVARERVEREGPR